MLTPAPTANIAPSRSASVATASATAGLALGLAASFPFLLIWGLAVLARSPEDFEGAAAVLLLATLGGWLGAGALFGLLAQRLTGGGTRRRAMWAGGLTLLAVGAVSLPGGFAFEAVHSLPLWQVFVLAFTTITFVAAFAVTFAVGRAIGVPRAARTALMAAVAAAATCALVSLALDPIPGWHVGGGQRAMVKVAAVADLVAGFVGGAASLALLARGSR